MINGVAPLLVYNFSIMPKSLLFNALSGIPVVNDPDVFDASGAKVGGISSFSFSLPIYLDEKVTGVFIENQSNALDIDTSIEAKSDGTRPDPTQRAINNTLTVNMLASRDSIFLSSLLALNDLIVPKLVSREYSISYFNRSAVILNGLLHGFTTSVSSDDTLIRIQMTIVKTNGAASLIPTLQRTASSALGTPG